MTQPSGFSNFTFLTIPHHETKKESYTYMRSGSDAAFPRCHIAYVQMGNERFDSIHKLVHFVADNETIAIGA